MKQIDRSVQYEAADAMALICKTASAKFDETVELHVRLGVDGRHADHVAIPHGERRTGRSGGLQQTGRRKPPVCRVGISLINNVISNSPPASFTSLRRATRQSPSPYL